MTSFPAEPPEMNNPFFPGGEGYSDRSDFFPEGTVDSFLGNWFSQHLRAMSEPRIHLLDSTITAFRFLWLPTFDEPICVRAQRQAERALLHTKRCDCQAGFGTGEVVLNDSRDISDLQWSRITATLNSIRFCELTPEDLGSAGLDGAHWVVEGHSTDQYHMVHRWSCGGLGIIAPFGFLMLELSGIGVKAAGIQDVDGIHL